MRNLSSRRRRMSGGADESLAQGKNFAANMPGQMRQMGGGNVYHGAPVLAGGDAMLLEGDLRGQAGVGSLDASTAAVRGMQDGGSRSRRRGRNNASARRSRKNNASMRKSRSRKNAPMRRGRNNASMLRSRNRKNAGMRRGRNNASARRSRKNNASMRKSRKNNASMRRNRKNNASMRRNRKNNASMRRRRNNAPAMRRRRNQMGGDGEENPEYLPEEYEGAVTPLERRRNNMYGGAHSLLPTDYASVNQSPALISGGAAAKAGTAFTSDPFANGSGSA